MRDSSADDQSIFFQLDRSVSHLEVFGFGSKTINDIRTLICKITHLGLRRALSLRSPFMVQVTLAVEAEARSHVERLLLCRIRII
jgi:hypothetical protein